MAEARESSGLPGDDIVSALVRTGLRRAPNRHWLWPVLALAAALVVGAILWPWDRDRPPARPPDQLLHQGTAWPRGAGIRAEELVEYGFEWLGDADETYELSLFAGSDLVTPFDTIPCDANHCSVDRRYVDTMRALGTDWRWQYQRTSPQIPGSPSVALSETYSFSFSH
ncbi:MAG TPA: hypothetical protein VFZ65_09895 [Planctomycetota bacterium]|nr:hypothetical protein [Planctomycetota bacterium]